MLIHCRVPSISYSLVLGQETLIDIHILKSRQIFFNAKLFLQ